MVVVNCCNYFERERERETLNREMDPPHIDNGLSAFTPSVRHTHTHTHTPDTRHQDMTLPDQTPRHRHQILTPNKPDIRHQILTPDIHTIYLHQTRPQILTPRQTRHKHHT
mgnify:CR=1 FL=1